MDWIRLSDDNIAEAFGADASHILLHHRDSLDEICRNWHRQADIDKLFTQTKYVRNVYYLLDTDGNVRAAGKTQAHCDAYAKPGYVTVIREALENKA
jgi:hypothetical protein